MIYFVIVLELFFTAATMSTGALEALVPEVTRGAEDRMNLVGIIYLCAVFGAGLGLAGSGALVDAYGYQVVATILAIVGLVVRYLALSAIWKRAPRDTTPAKVEFLRGMKETLRNPQFVYYLPHFRHVHDGSWHPPGMDAVLCLGTAGGRGGRENRQPYIHPS